jgi:hypothetical protein
MSAQERSQAPEAESSWAAPEAVESGPAAEPAASGRAPLLGGRLGRRMARAGWPPGDGAASLAGLTHPTGGGHRAAFAHQLQRQRGNRAVLGAIQTKLTIGQPGDVYEREAERVADAVMRMPGPGASVAAAQPRFHLRSGGDRTGPVQAQPASGRLSREQEASAAVARTLRAEGQPLPGRTRAFFEQRFGHEFRQVSVHAGDAAAESTRELQASAYTVGSDLVFAEGRYRPYSQEGRTLLAHELAHVVQQTSSAPTAIQCSFLTKTEPAGPETAEASLPAHPRRPPHEIVIMSGGPTSHREDPLHDESPLNYATAARIRIERLMESAFGGQRQMIPQDHITWLVVRPPYRYRAIEDGKAAGHYTEYLLRERLPYLQAAWNRLAGAWRGKHPEEGGDVQSGAQAISLHFVDGVADFIDFMNEGGAGGGRTHMSFATFTLASLPIGRFEYFGHGGPGLFWFTMGWRHLRVQDEILSTDDIASLDPNAFVQEGEYRSWSCNTAVPPDTNRASFIKAWVEHIGGRFVGAFGRTTYKLILDRKKVVLSTEEPAYWMTAQAVGSAPTEVAPAGAGAAPASIPSYPGWVHESDLPPETEGGGPAPEAGGESGATPGGVPGVSQWMPSPTELAAIGEGARASARAAEPEAGPTDMCIAEVVPLDEPADPGDLVCSPEGAGRLNINMCMPEDAPVSHTAAPEPSAGAPTGPGYYRVHECYVSNPDALCAPNAADPAWHPFLDAVANSAYNETLDINSLPGTGARLVGIGSEAYARSRGFYIGVVQRNGRIYYKIFGSRGAHAGIPGRWYAARNLPGTSAQLGRLVSPRVGLLSGLRSGTAGLGGALTVAGDVLQYAVDPQKEVASVDFAVDVGFDLLKSGVSTAAAGAAGAGVTSALAGGALGATIGSAAPVIGTIVGFVVGVLVAMAVEYFISDFRASVKAWLRERHDIRHTPGQAGASPGGTPAERQGGGGGQPGGGGK